MHGVASTLYLDSNFVDTQTHIVVPSLKVETLMAYSTTSFIFDAVCSNSNIGFCVALEMSLVCCILNV